MSGDDLQTRQFVFPRSSLTDPILPKVRETFMSLGVHKAAYFGHITHLRGNEMLRVLSTCLGRTLGEEHYFRHIFFLSFLE